jgi:hypothetical protein
VIVKAVLLGGPKDGLRIFVSGREVRFPILSVTHCESFVVDASSALSYEPIRCHVYQGPLRHPDRGHVAYRYAGIK